MDTSRTDRTPVDSSRRRVKRTPVLRKVGEAVRQVAGLPLLAAIVAAPWMYGSTRHWAIVGLCWMLSATVFLWAAGCGLRWQKPAIFRRAIYPVSFLISAGWLVVLAGPALPPDPFTQEHVRVLIQRWPGTFVLKTPIETMWLFSGLLGAFLVTMDLSSDRRWWVTIYTTMAVVGASIVLLGLLQIQTGAPGILWQTDVPNTGNFFATYFHHSVAGAFINLVWPLAAGGFLICLGGSGRMLGQRRGAVAFWGLLLLIGLCGPLAQVSRFAQVNALVLMFAFTGWLVWRRKKMGRWKLALGLLVSLIVLALFIGATAAWFGRLPEIGARWQKFAVGRPPAAAEYSGDFRMRADGFIAATQTGGFFGAREVAAKTCLRMIPEAGLLGFGPGSWTATYPHFTDDSMLRTFVLHVQFAHVDWLQTVVEWGILGALAWGALIAGGLWQAFRWLRWSRIGNVGIDSRETMVAGVVVALSGLLLHALIDFPLQIPSIQLYFVVLLGLAWASARVLVNRRRARTADGSLELAQPEAEDEAEARGDAA